MAAEYLAVNDQNVLLNAPIIFTASIPCTKGYIYHEDESGILILRGIVNNPCANYATYRISYNGNVAIPDGGTVTPVALALVINGEVRQSSKAIATPVATGDYTNLTSTGIIKVPRGCCFSLSVDYVSGITDGTTTPAVSIQAANSNLVIDRIA